MPLEEGERNYAGNGLYYLGRDLDFLLEMSNIFPSYSIWRLVPLSVILPHIQELIYIGIFQIIGSLLLLRLFVVNNKLMEYSVGRSIQISIKWILCLGVFVFFIEMVYFYFYQIDFLFANFVDQNIEQQKLNLHPIYFSFYFLVGCVGAAIFEELFFRKFLFSHFRKKMPFYLAAIISSLLFSFAHNFDFLILFQTFVCGLISCYIYEQSKSICGCILFHFLGNFILFLLPLFYPLELFN